ncbi:general odorant-binding protein 2-like [Cydia pomonella]|uniref:general odorant-binding protein 2-like n=1 Tax=Cydia pomonella TaxID=82600 RepID=UPI002ADD77BE|nr:general odorant-binding protein 2-like [Cydia pomonella]
MVIVFKMALYWIVLALVLAAGEMEATSEQSILTSRIAAIIGKDFESCRDEAQLTPEIMQEWAQIWDYDYELQREVGCAIFCVARQASLLLDNNLVDEDKLLDVVKTFIIDEDFAHKTVDLYMNCEKKYKDIEDNCSRVTKTFGCYRADVKEAGFAPYVGLIQDAMKEI